MSAGKLFLLLCVIVIGSSGCAGTQHHHEAYGAHGPLALASGASDGLQQVGHDEALLFIYAAVAVAIVFVVFVDLILLPIGCRDRAYYFPCCRALISCCH